MRYFIRHVMRVGIALTTLVVLLGCAPASPTHTQSQAKSASYCLVQAAWSASNIVAIVGFQDPKCVVSPVVVIKSTSNKVLQQLNAQPSIPPALLGKGYGRTFLGPLSFEAIVWTSSTMLVVRFRYAYRSGTISYTLLNLQPIAVHTVMQSGAVGYRAPASPPTGQLPTPLPAPDGHFVLLTNGVVVSR